MTKYFHEEFAKEEAELKISLEASRRAKAERQQKEKDWWDKIPDSTEYGTTKHKQPTEGNHIKKDAYDDRKKK